MKNNDEKTIHALQRELKKYQQELVELEAVRAQVATKSTILDSILDSLPHPFLVIDAATHALKLANKAALQGQSSTNLACYQLSHRRQSPCLGEEHPCPLAIIKTTKQPAVVEHLHYDEQGQPIYVEVYGFPIFDGAGNLVEMIEYSIDITLRKRAEQQLAYLATHDGLTALPNRTLFDLRLEHEIAHAQRNGKKLAILLLDLDGFKAINDNLGHAAGDQLLVSVAKTLKYLTRKSDTVARMGGDEFLLLLSGIDSAQDAEVTAQKILTAFINPFEIGSGQCVQVGTSLGIAIYPDDHNDGETLIRLADLAMYGAKKSTGGQYRRYLAEEGRA